MLREVISYSIAASESVRLVQITDPHLFADDEGQLLGVNTANSLEAVVNTVAAGNYPAHFMLATGDISQDYTPQSYHNFVRAVAPLNLPCHYLPGNHDDPRVMHLNMQGKRVHGQQHILIGNWQILLLDSTVRGKPGGFLAPSQFDLIEQAIEAYPARHVLLVMHHNPIQVGCAWLDQHCLVNGDEFMQRIAAIVQIRGVLWGHIHHQLDQSVKGLQQDIRLMATPSTCVQFKPESDYFALDALQPGYRLLELRPDGSMLTNVFRVPGERFSPDKNASGY
ncbi:MAG: 3',5'-cyclic-AMP phosphodiesterase [Shewanella sp.]|nr:3',5'-cyclic-AMP phosphodiesterase [Shewanella sp.]MCF1429416.1 3',5'-cyclic-AMP phosphodiesterase [Shewanella sp.]MCF1439354.1 3',5'-cyclic-AMP phosphodiesterase [Shewanella sp.]MCF1456011.1 3',5'-cyclic-AMP phosphodiesterase [Shewanella sp.]